MMDFDIGKALRTLTEQLEGAMKQMESGSLEWAEARLAWHKLVEAHTLLFPNRSRPEDLIWGYREAKKRGWVEE